ncbi:hypothetical protein [Leisingera sp. ANG59]|uniref:hypothetical protein n=1 Tax=Leisingera sp. ANG59 TaxID=2675221 RepID=UPI0015719C09|nr:hypothetical protein [Leisingera sp. ANG59]NSY37527.1 hypothetical protein [Leisingera sp. ANG59]
MFKAFLDSLLNAKKHAEHAADPFTGVKEVLNFNPDNIVNDAIDEAIEHLGLLKPSAKPSIQALIPRCMAEGFKAVSLSHRKDGEQLSKEEKKALRIRSNGFMSKTAASELSETGRLKPLEAHFLTLWRADFTIDRAKSIVAASSQEFGCINQLGGHRDGCALCAENYDKAIDPFKASPFPPVECPNAACGMMFRVSVDWVAVHKKQR